MREVHVFPRWELFRTYGRRSRSRQGGRLFPVRSREAEVDGQVEVSNAKTVQGNHHAMITRDSWWD